MLNFIQIMSLLIILSSCRSMGGFSAPLINPISSIDTTSQAENANNLDDQDDQDHLEVASLYYPYVSVISEEETTSCEYKKTVTEIGQPGLAGRWRAIDLVKRAAAIEKSNRIVIDVKNDGPLDNHIVTGKIYHCGEKAPPINELKQEKINSHENSDFSFFFGRYMDRQGILKNFGELSYHLGIEYASFGLGKKSYDNGSLPLTNHGLFVLWTFDHILKANQNLLKHEFKDKDFTNYVLAFGYAFRYIPHHRWQLHYRGGLAINFIEIDTFRKKENSDKDSHYSDITISTVHKIGLDFLVDPISPNDIYRQKQIRVGPSLFYYFSPDPLGKFKFGKNSQGNLGGSLAGQFELKIEFY